MRNTQPEALLKTHGLRRSQARVRILTLLKTAKKPLSHADILARVGNPK